MKKAKFSVIMTLLLIATSINPMLANSATKWNLDKAHTQVLFSVNHYFTPVSGKFEDFDITLHFDPENLKESSIDVIINVASVNTGNTKRDGHLQTGDFFNAEKFPQITFKSSEIMSKGDNKFVAKGKLKIKDVEKNVELPFTLLGVKELAEEMSKKMRGKKKIASFEANHSLNRSEYGVGTGNWASTLVVGGEVYITITVESYI
jgi:polyisoprenoid-binding protein YceI